MIDFTNVISITIPEGIATKIARGGEILWEKSIAEQEPIVVFPLTAISASIAGAWSTIKTSIVFSRTASAGENYIIYLDGTAYNATATSLGDDPGYLQLSVSNQITLTTKAFGGVYDGSTWGGKIMGWVTSATLEIHYIP